MRGRFQGWKPDQNYGFISIDGEIRGIFLHKTKLIDPERVFEGALLEFDVSESDRGKSAENVFVVDQGEAPSEASRERRQGIVKFFGGNFGFITPEKGVEDIYFSSRSLKESGLPYLIENDIVEFSTRSTSKGSEALEIKKLGYEKTGNAFTDLIDLQAIDWAETIAGDRGIAENEDWTFGRTNAGPYPVLQNYIKYTFFRLHETEGLRYSEDGSRMAFNTGLVTNLQQEIFLLFRRSVNPEARPWTLFRVCTDSDREFVNNFGANYPPLAEYFQDPTDLLFDRRLKLHVDVNHIIEHNLGRFPKHLQSNSFLAHQLLTAAQATTEKRVYRNYKAAIPQFFREAGGSGEIQLLLPICLEQPNRADLALTVARNPGRNAYLSSTVLTLYMAFGNARLLCRPDTEWLRPSDSDGGSSNAERSTAREIAY